MQHLLPAETSASLIGQVHLADCLDLCERVYRAGLRVDMILADLPYGTTACAWDTIIPFEPMWKAFKRIIKPRGAIVLTASQPFTSMLIMSNLKWHHEELIWVKQHPKGFLDARRKHLDAHESVQVFCKGMPTYYPQGLIAVNIKSGRQNKMGNGVYGKVGNPDYVQTVGNFPRTVLHFDAITQGNLHPTQKPVDLFRYLIRTYTEVGQVVFDPTCGSGTTGLAATIEKRRFICGDSDPGYVDIARNRLRMHNGDVSDLPLFAQPA